MLFYCNNNWMKAPQCDVIHTSPVLIGMWYCTEWKIKGTVEERTFSSVTFRRRVRSPPSGYESVSPEHWDNKFLWNIKFLPDITTSHFEGNKLQSNSRISNLPCRTLKFVLHVPRGREETGLPPEHVHAEPRYLLRFQRRQHCQILFGCASVRYSGHCLNVWTGFWSVFIHLLWCLLL